jgi:hypothetical protein
MAVHDADTYPVNWPPDPHAWLTPSRQGYRLTLHVTDEHRSAAVAFYEATGWLYSHSTGADWTTADGRPVRLRHYRLDGCDTGGEGSGRRLTQV